jgi:hypothetical protein
VFWEYAVCDGCVLACKLLPCVYAQYQSVPYSTITVLHEARAAQFCTLSMPRQLMHVQTYVLLYFPFVDGIIIIMLPIKP